MTTVQPFQAETAEPRIALADVESALALFAEGIAGRYLHIRSNHEFAANPKLALDETGGQNSDTLFLPESIATTHASTYRLSLIHISEPTRRP